MDGTLTYHCITVFIISLLYGCCVSILHIYHTIDCIMEHNKHCGYGIVVHVKPIQKRKTYVDVDDAQSNLTQ
jgi:hypothetical protein